MSGPRGREPHHAGRVGSMLKRREEVVTPEWLAVLRESTAKQQER
jgi:hypothetical protein